MFVSFGRSCDRSVSLATFFAAALAIFFSSTGFEVHAKVEAWNACLKSPGGDLCFGLELEKRPNDTWRAAITNGSERIEIPKVSVDPKGEISLQIDHYDSTLTLIRIGAQELKGNWKKRRSGDKWVEMQCVAELSHATDNRTESPNTRFDGRWSVSFELSDDPAVGVFKTDKTSGQLRGTFLTTTGDYRYLAGNVSDGQMRLSCFDGAHAFLFTASVQPDGSLQGDFWSSDSWHETWTATRNDDAKIADSFEATKAIKTSIDSLSFPDLEGNMTRLADKKFAAAVRIVHVFGSWCPNCHDAAKYLAELNEKYGDKISIVGVAFELTGDFSRDANQVRRYLKRHKLDHAVLIGGTSDKAFATKAMKIIDRVRSYPTTIFADADGKITAVHQGFSGPATGDAYDQQCQRFVETIETTLLESRQ